jgi:hypothetical protein
MYEINAVVGTLANCVGSYTLSTALVTARSNFTGSMKGFVCFYCGCEICDNWRRPFLMDSAMLNHQDISDDHLSLFPTSYRGRPAAAAITTRASISTS